MNIEQRMTDIEHTLKTLNEKITSLQELITLKMQNNISDVTMQNKCFHTYSDIDDKDKIVYDVKKLIEIVPKEIYTIETFKLSTNLNKEIWTDNKNNKIKPIDVLDNIDNVLYRQHKERIMNADMKYPIILNPKDKIADGIHRLCYAVINKIETMKYYKFDNLKQMEPAIITE